MSVTTAKPELYSTSWSLSWPAPSTMPRRLPRTRQELVGWRLVKRSIDLCLSLGLAICFAPLMAALYVLVRTTSPGPVFYSQSRLGLDKVSFHAWKFRTMVQNADEVLEDYLNSDAALREEWDRDHKLKNDPRVTWIGGLLRKSSLDELPQIWNVLRGDMSLVGPRPIVEAEVIKYGETFDLYRKVMPGVTGLWQVSGRNNTTYEERVALDGRYARDWSLWFDICILVRTVKTVLLREGAY